MIKLCATALIFLAMASQAIALSCLRPNIGRTFNTIATSESIYLMGQGTLTATEKIPDYKQGVERQIRANFTGVFYGVTGTSTKRTISVTVDAICFASWCGNFPKTNKKTVVFLKQSPNGLRLESNPCEGHFKVSPTSKDMRILQECLKNGMCSKAQIQALEPNF